MLACVLVCFIARRWFLAFGSSDATVLCYLRRAERYKHPSNARMIFIVITYMHTYLLYR